MKKILIFLSLFSSMFTLTSCFQEEIPVIKPSYEKIGIFNDSLKVYWSWAKTEEWELISFNIQKNKFILDKDLNFFNDKYSYLLKSKDIESNSYVWIKLKSLDDVTINFWKDIERVLQSKNISYSLTENINECIVNKEWTELGVWTIYMKKCNNLDYMIQLTKEPYDNKEWGKEVDYKAILINKELKEFIINEYFNSINNIDWFDIGFIDLWKKESINYTYLDNYNNYNWFVEKKEWKSVLESFVSDRRVIVKWDYIVIFDLLLEQNKLSNKNIEDETSSKIDIRFPLIENININLDKLDLWNISWKFNEKFILDDEYLVEINDFLLHESEDEENKLTKYSWRFPNTMYVEIYEHSKTSYGLKFLNKFKKDFGYKKWFNWPISHINFDQYTYKWEEKTYILLRGKDEKWNKEFKWNYIYVELNNNFIKENIKTFNNFIWIIK